VNLTPCFLIIIRGIIRFNWLYVRLLPLLLLETVTLKPSELTPNTANYNENSK
jgi:hypothetical protein